MAVGWIIVVVIVAVLVVAAWALWSRSRKAPEAAAATPAPERVSRVTDPTPMTGLEVALDQVTDRSGRNMRDKIETGTAIDDLIVPDDTGPLLRRALDHVEQAEPVEHAGPAASAPASEQASERPAAEPAGGETSTNEG